MCGWSKKPASAATIAVGMPLRSNSMAALIRSRDRYRYGGIPTSRRNAVLNWKIVSPAMSASCESVTGSSRCCSMNNTARWIAAVRTAFDRLRSGATMSCVNNIGWPLRACE